MWIGTLVGVFQLTLISLCMCSNWRPVVLMHGLEADAETLSLVEQWIQADFPGIYIRNIEIGNGREDSLEMNINLQISVFAQIVKNDTMLKNGFNLIGHSQGGLITRAYVERYNSPPVYNLISWVGPHDGVYGVPDFNALCPDVKCPLLIHLVDMLLDGGPPTVWVQEKFSFAAYWKSPYDYDVYLADNIFLSDINNERSQKNATYKKNLTSLNNYLLVYSSSDTIVVPRQSPWFYFYREQSVTEIVPLNQTQQYTEDWIGLRTLDSQGKLDMQVVPCGHMEIRKAGCGHTYYELYTRKYLNNTL